MDAFEAVQTLIPIATTLESLDVAYYVGGSVASSTHGRFRSTEDADVVAELRPRHVEAIVRNLREDHYVSPDAVRDAVRGKHSFNVISNETSLKVDIFVSRDRPYDRQAIGRAARIQLDPMDPFVSLPIASPEDTVLAKLEWFAATDRRSDQQWRDIIGVLQVQGERLDRRYLRRWAVELGVLGSLGEAFTAAGLRDRE